MILERPTAGLIFLNIFLQSTFMKSFLNLKINKFIFERRFLLNPV